MTTLVYRYGLLPPIENASLVRNQMRLAHEYRNTLVAIERGYRQVVSEYTDSDEEVRRLLGALSGTSEDDKATRKVLYGQLSKARADARKRLVPYDVLNERKSWIEKNCRANCGVFWGTYLLVEAAMDQVRADTPAYELPRFARWEGEGLVSMQVQKARQADPSTIFQIHDAPLPPGADPNSKRSQLRPRKVLWLRVGSDEKRKPVWAKFPMILHRPLPEGATVTWVKVTKRRIGPRDEWSAHFTVSLPDARAPRNSSDSRVAVDVGWRKLDSGGIRIAAWCDESGEQGFVELDAYHVSGLQKVDDLQAIRDKNANRMKAEVSRLLPEVVPAWWPRSIAQWHSTDRLNAFVRRWSRNRFEGDEVAFEWAETWRYHDHHLWVWQRSHQKKILRRRLDHYRNVAANLSRRYGVLVLEGDFNISETVEGQERQRKRQEASAGEFRSALIQAFRGRVEGVPAKFTTLACADCGDVSKDWDPAKELVHTCSSCGSKWDQDINACRNLLAARERPGDAREPGVARGVEKSKDLAAIRNEKRESKWSRVAREKLERETARASGS